MTPSILLQGTVLLKVDPSVLFFLFGPNLTPVINDSSLQIAMVVFFQSFQCVAPSFL